MRSLLRDASLSAVVAGVVAVLVSYAGPFVVVLAAARAAGVDAPTTASWVWAISIGSGAAALGLSLWTRQPIVVAWSTPGAALLVTSLPGHTWPDAVGAFCVAALAMTLVGATGVFGALLARVPAGVVAAMLAGILFPFATGGFAAMAAVPAIVVPVLVAFFVLRRVRPRWAVLGGLAAGLAATAVTGGFRPVHAGQWLTVPQVTVPHLSLGPLIGIAVPLFVVAAASQNAPGLGVLRVSGYVPDDRRLVTTTGAVSLLLAPFGSPGVNLAAITAAICTGEEAHADRERRYVAGVACGVTYLLVGVVGGGLVAVFAALPHELVAAVSAVALLGALLGGIVAAVADEEHREAALVTFAVTAGGVSIAHIGAAFWGLVLGMAVHLVLRGRLRRATPVPADAAPAGAPVAAPDGGTDAPGTPVTRRYTRPGSRDDDGTSAQP
ncbi:MAG: benzoate/H(+) symporter BenE family transporter [Kineosporiaceae bacterium]